jgi:hypothetical protein
MQRKHCYYLSRLIIDVFEQMNLPKSRNGTNAEYGHANCDVQYCMSVEMGFTVVLNDGVEMPHPTQYHPFELNYDQKLKSVGVRCV